MKSDVIFEVGRSWTNHSMKGTIDSSQLLHGGRDNVYVQSTNKDSLHMSSLQTPAAQEKIKDVTQIFYTNEDVRRDTGMNVSDAILSVI